MNDRPTLRAAMLAILLWPACAVGGFLGSVTGLIGGSLGEAGPGSWAALGWAALGLMVGIPIGAALLGWIWAVACRRRRWIPILVLTVVAAVGAWVFVPVAVSSPPGGVGFGRIAMFAAVFLVVSALAFVVGLRTPPRREPRAAAPPLIRA